MKTITQQNTSTSGLFETNNFIDRNGFTDHQGTKLFSQNQHLQFALSAAAKLDLEPAKKNRRSASQ